MQLIAWDAGRSYSFAWALYIIITLAAILLNGISLFVIGFHRNVRSKVNMATAISILTAVDFFGSLGCFIKWSMNNFHLEIYGHEMGCAAEGYIFTLSILCQASTLALVAYITERTVCGGMKFEDNQVFLMAAITLLGSGSLAAIGVFAPYGGYRLMSSGTFCFVDLTSTIGGALFAFSVLASTGVMMHRYVRIWKYLFAARQLLRSRGFRHVRAKTQSVLVSIKMLFFIGTFFICALPFLVSELYEIITWEHVSPGASILGALLLLVAAVVDPIIFLFLNAEMQDAIKVEFGHIIGPLLGLENYKYVPPVTRRMAGKNGWVPTKNGLGAIAPHSNGGKLAGVVPSTPTKAFLNKDNNMPQSKSSLVPLGDGNNNKNNINGNHIHNRPKRVRRMMKIDVTAAEWETWLYKKEFWKLFETWCESCYVIENILFYRDVHQYQRKAAEMTGKIEWMLKQNGYSGGPGVDSLRSRGSQDSTSKRQHPEEDEEASTMTTEDVPQHILKDWRALQIIAAKIYEIYILAPTAPLEINIPATARMSIQKNLGIKSVANSPRPLIAISPKVSVHAAIPLTAVAPKDGNSSPAAFPEVWLLPPAKAMRKMRDIENIFKEALNIITKLTTSDIFPRFVKTDSYKTIKTTSIQSLRHATAAMNVANMEHASTKVAPGS